MFGIAVDFEEFDSEDKEHEETSRMLWVLPWLLLASRKFFMTATEAAAAAAVAAPIHSSKSWKFFVEEMVAAAALAAACADASMAKSVQGKSSAA